MPGYLAVVVVLLLLAPLIQPSGDVVSWRHLTASVLTLREQGLPNPFHGQPYTNMNGSLWTIHYEFLMYLVLMGLGLAGVLRRRSAMVALFLLLATVAVLQSKPSTALFGETLYPWIDRIDVIPRWSAHFLAGALLFQFRDSLTLRGRYAAAAGAAFLVIGIGLDLPVVSSIFLAPYLLAWLGLATRPLDLTGDYDLSYGVYITAYPIQQMVIRYAPADVQTGFPIFVVSTFVSLAAAWLSWRFIERPSIRQRARVVAALRRPVRGRRPVHTRVPSQ